MAWQGCQGHPSTIIYVTPASTPKFQGHQLIIHARYLLCSNFPAS